MLVYKIHKQETAAECNNRATKRARALFVALLLHSAAVSWKRAGFVAGIRVGA